MIIIAPFIGFERRRCETSGKWEPEAPSCKETLCKDLVAPSNGTMVLTTLRIGGRATFKCQDGFSLKGDDDIECLSSGSWSSWPPSCIEVDCMQPHEIENGRVFLSNGTTNIGSIVEYHCFPGTYYYMLQLPYFYFNLASIIKNR